MSLVNIGSCQGTLVKVCHLTIKINTIFIFQLEVGSTELKNSCKSWTGWNAFIKCFTHNLMSNYALSDKFFQWLVNFMWIKKWSIALMVPEWFELSKQTPFLSHQCISSLGGPSSSSFPSLFLNMSNYFFNLLQASTYKSSLSPLTIRSPTLKLPPIPHTKLPIAASFLFFHNPCNSVETRSAFLQFLAPFKIPFR